MDERRHAVRRSSGGHVAHRLLLTVALVAALVVVVVPGAGAATPVPPANVYVVGSGASGKLLPLPLGGTVPGTPIDVGNDPHYTALSPTGHAAYVSNFGGDSVTAVDLVTGLPGSTVSVGDKPEGIAVTPKGDKAYVAVSGANEVVPLVLSGSTISKGNGILAGLNPVGIAITPNGSTAYVTNAGSASVTPINLAAGTTGRPIPVGLNPQGIAVAPNGLTVYVVNQGSASVTPITTADNLPKPPIRIDGATPGAANTPSQIAISPDGLRAYVTNPGGSSVHVINLQSQNEIADIALPEELSPSHVAVAPNGATLYVTSTMGNALIPVSISGPNPTYAQGPVLTGFTGAMGVAITPDQAPVATLTASASVVPAGTEVTLDASGSTTAYGTITGYNFVFGDGTDPVLSTTPIVTHVYQSPGIFQARVYEVNSNGSSFASVYTGQTMSRNSPMRNGLPQDAAAVSISVTGPPVPERTQMMFVSNFKTGNITPVALSEIAAPAPSSPVAVSRGPAFSAVSGDGKAAVVGNFQSNTLTPLSVCSTPTGDKSVIPGAPTPAGSVIAPSEIAISPVPIARTETRSEWAVYAVSSGSNDVRRFALSIDYALCTATLVPNPAALQASIIPVGAAPYGIAITPNGQTAFVSNSGAASVTPINLGTGMPGTPIPVGVKPRGIAVAPDGKTVYVANGDTATVTPITVESRLPGTPIQVGLNPLLLAITPDGRTAYVTNVSPANVTPIDLANGIALQPIGFPAGSSPQGVTISSDGFTAYVGDYAKGAVHRIDTATHSFIGEPVIGFQGALGLSITPDQAPVAKLAASATTVPAGTTVTFDATASTVEYGTIEKYSFNFGDGTPAKLQTSGCLPAVCPLGLGKISHTYATPGTYPAVVYQLSSNGTGTASSYTGKTYGRFAPKQPNGAPQNAAGIFINVTAPAGAIPSGSAVLYASNLAQDSLTPVALPTTGPPSVGSPIPVGNGPAFSATSPDGNALVVTNFLGNSLTPVAVCSAGGSIAYTPGTPIATAKSPSQVAISPIAAAGSTAEVPKWDVYVAMSGSDHVRHYVLTINVAACTASLSVSEPISASLIPVGQAPYGIAITPDGRTAYVSNSGSHTVTPIDLETSQPKLPSITVGQRPQGVALTATTVYVANSGSNTVTPIDIATNTPGLPINVGVRPTVIAVSPDGATAFVTNAGNRSVTQLNLLSNQVIRTIQIPGGAPTGIAVSPDGTTAWVAVFATGKLLPINVSNGAIGINAVGGLQQPVGLSSAITP